MRRFRRAPGVLVESIGEVWAVFAGLTGETHLLNDESVALLEALGAHTCDAEAVAVVLAADCEIPVVQMRERLTGVWDRLLEAGLVLELPADDLSVP